MKKIKLVMDKRKSINLIYDSLKNKVRYDALFEIKHITQVINSIETITNNKILGYWLHNERINPTLSFEKINDTVLYFELPEEARLAYKNWGYENISEIKKCNHSIVCNNYLLVFPKGFEILDIHKILIECLSLIARRSINAANINIASNRRIYNKVNSILAKTDSSSIFSETLNECLNSFAELSNYQTLFLKLVPCEKLITIELCKDKFLINSLEPKLSNYFDDLMESYSKSIPIIKELCHKKFLLFHPFEVVDGQLNGDKFFLLLLSDSDFKTHDVFGISSFVSSFEDIYKKTQKLELISKIRNSTISRTLDEVKSYTNIRKDFCNFLQSIIKDIYLILNCHSLTLRMFEPIDNALHCWFESESKTGEVKNCDDSIPISSYQHSVNSFTFLIASHYFGYVYINNLNDKSIPNLYKDKGLKSSLPRRNMSQSEICLPFKFHGVTVGTVNVESVDKRAFDDEINFLLSLKSELENKFSNYFETIDMSWMKHRSNYSEQLHELNNYISSKGFFSDKQKQVLESIFFQVSDKTYPKKSKELNDIKIWVDQWLNLNYLQETDETINKIRNIVRYAQSTKLNFSQKVFDTLNIIIKHLIVNIINHSYIDKDNIFVSTTARYRPEGKGKDCIRIRFKTNGIVEKEDLDVICLKPIYRETDEDKPLHYGLYTLGLLTRSAGGFVFISPTDHMGKTIIEFTIPAISE